MTVNNLSYFPYKRNHYYNGKLLSVTEFETEQKYLNDKRRLSNRFLGGFGVVCGLQVIALSRDSISLEPGFAIDGYGREIVVSRPDVRRLSDLEGFLQWDERKNGYLYLEYEEKLTDEVKSGNFSVHTEEAENCCNSVSEQYRLYITEQPPTPNSGSVEDYYQQQAVLYESTDVTVKLCLPRYLASAQPFCLRLRVIPANPKQDITLKMKLQLHCVRYQGREMLSIFFQSKNARYAHGGYETDYYCQSMNLAQDLAEILVEQEGFQLEVSGQVIRLPKSVRIQSVVTNRPVEDCVAQDYQSEIMQYASDNPCKDICLAQLCMEADEIGFCIGEVRPVPWGQWVYSNPQLALEQMVLRDRITLLQYQLSSLEQPEAVQPAQENGLQMTSGDAVIRLGIGGKVGKRFFSQEIPHGLGLGNVTIVLGVVENDPQTGGIVYGSPEIFDEQRAVVMAETAVRLDPRKGTFVIGVRLLEPTSQYEISIHWTALRYVDQKKLAQEKKMIIHSGVKSLRVLESVYLTVKFIHMNQSDVIWSVEGENSGSINANGCYTAPNRPGVYQVTATCAYDSSIKASAFLVVKP